MPLSAGCLLALACSEERGPIFFGDPDAATLEPLGGRGGSAGSGGGWPRSEAGAGGMGGAAGTSGASSVGGAAGMGGSSGASTAGGAGGADAGAAECSGDAGVGAPCGDATDGECSKPDSCGPSGLCQDNHEPDGTACSGGSCALGVCVPGQPVGCPAEVVSAVPFTGSWSSVGKPELYVGGCDSLGTPDYALVFIAPATATFRFSVQALVDDTPYTGADQTEPFTEPEDGDAVLTVAEGSCAGGGATQIACNDDASEGSLDAQLELALASGQVITLYLNELTQTGGGTGTLTITQLP